MRRIPVFFAVLLLVLAASTVSAQELRRTVFPQLGIGGGWSCDFFVNNQGFAGVTGVKISFFDDTGAALVVQTSDLGSGSSFQFNLAAGETKVIRASGGASTVAGYAELIAPKGSAIRGTMVVRLASGGQTSTQLGVSEQYPFSHYSFAAEVKSSAQVDTGLAFANPRLSFTTALPIDLVISLINSAGTVQGTKVVTLAAGQHTSTFLGGGTGLFPGLDNFLGTVSVSAPDHFGLLALRLEGGALGAVSVNEGAIIAPYFLNQQATSEVEANDSTTTAHQLTLPAVVSGVISTKDDIDYFKFTGQKGQVVTVLVELPAGSELDSEVFLLNSASDILAWNDQNGLGGPFSAETDLPEYASLMTAILPADGTYYVKLWDWVGEFGGSTFTYRMHVSTKTP